MDKIHKFASSPARMPGFDDGMVSMVELIRLMAESLTNGIMDAQADDARDVGDQRSRVVRVFLAEGFSTG